MSKGYLKGWIVVRLLVVLCLLTQTVVPVIAQEPIPVEEPQLPPADPEDLIVEPWEDNGLGPAMDIDPVVTLEPPLTLPEQASSVSELIPPGFTTTQAVTSTNGLTETAVITSTGGVITPAGGVISSLDSQRILTETGIFTGTAVSFLSGQLTLIAPDGAFTQGVTITLQPITATGVITQSYTISDSAGSPITVTRQSYELFRFELEAIGLSDGQPVTIFDKPVYLVVDMRGMADITPGPNWYIGYQDENNPSTWHYPVVNVHDDTGLVSVHTNHFSGWSAGNLPAAWRYRWNVPAVSTFSGAATFQYPIEVPAGRGGLTPNIDISYSSRSLDGLIFTDDMDQGPFGLGWGINNIEISRNNIDFSDNGSYVYLKHGDIFSLVLNGASYQLKRYGTGSDYYAINAPGLRIQQVYNTNAQNSDDVYWTVRTADGTTYRLGFTEDSETGQEASCCLSTEGIQLGGSRSDYGAIRWRVDTVTDIHGNQIQYDYYEWLEEPENYLSSMGITNTVTTGGARLREIRYNYVDVDTSDNADWRVTGSYATKIVFGPEETEWIGYIDLYHSQNLDAPYRRIVIDSIEHFSGNTEPCPADRTSSVGKVVSITEQNEAGTIALPATTFDYIPLEHKAGTSDCFIFAYLEEVNNGYGGRIKFTYAGDGRWAGTLQNPKYGQSFRVTQTEIWDGIHSEPAVTEYDFEFPCYDQEDGDLGTLPDPENCQSRSSVLYYIYGHGPLVGFGKTTITAFDYDGTTILSQSIDEFWRGLTPADRILQGRPYRQRLLDPNLSASLALQQIDTTYVLTSGLSHSFTMPSIVTTTSAVLGGSLTRQVDYTYDQYGNVTYTHEFGDITSIYDDRHIYHDYSPNPTAWIVNKVARAQIYGPGSKETPGNHERTETRYIYDDNPSWTTAPTIGNLTEVKQAVTFSPQRTYITTQSLVYDDTYSSNVIEIADGNVHTTTITYDSNFTLLPVTVENAAEYTQTFQYYGFESVALDGNQAGLLKKVTDANDAATQFYYDPFGRLERVVRPGDTHSSPSEFYRYYDYTGFRLTPGPVMILSWRKTQNGAIPASNGGVWERLFFDGLGRTIQTQTPHINWQGSGAGQQIHLDTVYNAAGQALSQSVPYLKPAYVRGETDDLIHNPYVTPDSVAQVTTQYNAAGQPVRTVGLDGAVSSLLYGRQVTYAQDGNNHTKISFFTAHGQLWSVDELVGNFRDTFGSNGSLDDWTETAGVAVSSGAAHLTNSGSTTYMYRDLEEASSQDVAVTLSFYSSDEDLDAWLNLHDGSGASYRGWGLRIYDENLYLEKKSGATITQILLMPFKPNTWYRLLLRNSKSGSRSLALLVWEENNPDIMAEIRELPAGSSWHTDNWRFQANVYSNGTTLDLDNYDEYDVNRTIYTYDPVGNLTQVTPPTGPVTTIGYDNIGRKTTMTDPDMGTWTYEYDNAGNLISQTDNKDEEIVFTYDELNRLVEKSHDSVTLAEYFYDETAGVNGIGRRTSMVAYDATGAFSNSASWTYDTRGRAITETRTIDVGGVNKTYNFSYGYTEGNLPVTMTYPGDSSGGTGELVTTKYWWQTAAPKGLVGDYWVVGSNTNNIGASYTASGQLNTLRLGNDVVTTYGYDPAYRINTIVNSPVYQDLDYDYDKVGNVTKITDYNFNYPAEDQAQVFSYDSLNRLVAACTLTTISGTTCTSDSDDGHYDEEYRYDVLGNLTSKAGVTQTYTSTLPHAITGLNGVGHFEYDDNGNMIERDDGSAIWDYTWTVDNRLATASNGTITVTFSYDADGNMVLREEGSAAKVYLGKLYQHELPADTETKHFLFAGQLVALRDDAGYFKFFLTDHLGGTNVTVDAIGDVVANVRYGPWGNERWASGTTPTEYQYTGQRADTTLGIYDYGARYYDPTIGRFLSADSIVPNPADPQSHNRYSYVLNSPLRYIDPTGHRPTNGCEYEGCNLANGLDPNSTWILPNGKTYTFDPALPNEYTPASEMLTGWLALLGIVAAPTVVGYVIGDIAIPTLTQIGEALLAWLCRDGNCTNEVESVWRIRDYFERGRVIERMLGQNLPQNFPTIDRWWNGTATSIKSIDLTLRSYQNIAYLENTVWRYINQVANFNGAAHSHVTITANQITARQLIVAVPQQATVLQMETLYGLQYSASLRGVEMIIVVLP